ncbi:hypothetical protein NC652_008391 [Populus alba x Populus x berolinensis]|nr:hypothetical protein NC652_008391 [Populus alba x Populus x berolinensis]
MMQDKPGTTTQEVAIIQPDEQPTSNTLAGTPCKNPCTAGIHERKLRNFQANGSSCNPTANKFQRGGSHQEDK